MRNSADESVAVIEYGATARGDADQHSDRDICLVIEDVDELQMEALRERAANSFNIDPIGVSCYRLTTLDKMVQGGSLFLWHLRLEGKLLTDPDGIMRAALLALSSYDHFLRDIDRFAAVFADVVDEYHWTRTLSPFEHHVLCVVARNICMLITVHAGVPAFGRSSVFARAKQLYPQLPLSGDVWNTLVMWHLKFMRNVDVAPLANDCHADRILKEVTDLLEFTRTIVS